MRKLAIAILLILSLFGGLVAVLRSEWGREKAKTLLSDALQRSGFQVDVGHIDGTLPNRLVLQNVFIKKEDLEITVQTIDLELSLFRLLKREVAFLHLYADGITWKGKPDLKQDLNLYVEYFRLLNVAIPNYFTANFEGRLKLGKRTRFLDVRASRPEFPNDTSHLVLLIQKDGTLQWRGDLNLTTLKSLDITAPFDASLKTHFTGTGKGTILQGKIQGTITPRSVPFQLEREWTFAGRFQRNNQGQFLISNLSARSDLLNAKAKATFDPTFHLQEATGQIESDHLLPAFFPGRMFAYLHVVPEENALRATGTIQIPSHSLRGNIDALWKNSALEGTGEAFAKIYGEEWQAKSNFSWADGAPLYLPTLEVKGPYAEGKGNLEISPDGMLIGTQEIAAENLQALHLPYPDFYGTLKAKLEWMPLEEKQGLRFDGIFTDFYYGQIYSQKVSLYSDLINPFHELQGNLYLDFERFKWKTLELESASLETSNEGENWPFRFFGEGTWKHPLEVHMNGYWHYQEPDFLAVIQDWNGYYYKHPFALKSPVSFEFSPDIFRLTDLEIGFEKASLFAMVNRKGDHTEAHLKLNQLPLDILSVNPLEVSIAGRINLETTLVEEKEQLNGDLIASIEQMEVESINETGKLNASGKLEGHFDRDRLNFKANLIARNAPLLNLDASIPIHLSIWPFEAAVLPEKNAKGQILLNGPIQDFLDFFDLGTHRLEGICICDLKFSNTLYRPLLEGRCQFENGIYQNYYTGTELKNIRADWLAEKQTLYLRSLTAEDMTGGGILTAVGEIHLIPREFFPFRFDLSFRNLNFVDIDLVTAIANGKINIQGNSDAALATGNVNVAESRLTIPDHIPRPLPNLQVIYRNPSRPIVPPESDDFHPYPFNLDLHLTAPDHIFISGRGLDSEWKGDFHVGGTFTEIAAQGNLELIAGEFNFSSRTFTLTEGTLSLTGKEHEMPYLNLAGATTQKGILITARLKGPLNAPQVSLQSTPPLPLSTIMSYLLFGQDLSELTGYQALQLATSLTSLVGEGPDIMESTRRALGLDRLRIIGPPGIDGNETVSIQTGKYAAEGVIVNFSQGAEDSSTNASVQVEIKDNFVFQAESLQQEEQGKFTFKWTLNY